MPIAPSFDDLVIDGQSEMQARRPDLQFNEGDVALAIVHGGAAMADRTIGYAAELFKATFLDLAESTDLDTLAYDRYNLVRVPATSAQVTLTFARTSGGAAGVIPAGTQVNTVQTVGNTQISFTTDALVNVPLADNGPFTVAATALVSGSSGNVAAATLTEVGALFDTFTVTNAAAAAGGNSAESDTNLRQRCRAFYQTLRRGTADALEFGAKQVASVRFVSVVEDLSGYVTVVVSDQDGNSTVEMVSDVETELEEWRCAGVPVTVEGGTPYEIDLALTLDVDDGFDVTVASADIISAIEAKLDNTSPGDTVTLHEIIAAIIGLFPNDIRKVNFISIYANSGALSTSADITPTLSYQKIKSGTITVAAS